MEDLKEMETPSRAYVAMQAYWSLVQAIEGGVESMRSQRETYLPRFPAEDDESYSYRLSTAKFVNVFGTIAGSLAAKPFTEEVKLQGASEQYDPLVENVDGSGNHLHVFAQTVFGRGLRYAVDWIFVDYPTAANFANRAEEQRAGARPTWLRIPAQNMLAVHSAMTAGREEFTYARFLIYGTGIAENGEEEYETACREYVRPRIYDEEGNVSGYGPAQWREYVKDSEDSTWALRAEGELSIGVIPLVYFAPAGRVENSWVFHKPLENIATLQLEHYQQETSLKAARDLVAFPMLSGEGVSPPRGRNGADPEVIRVGPGSVLYAPQGPTGAGGKWSILEPSATSLEFLAKEVERLETQMHEQGRVPLIQGTAGITVIAAALHSQEASSALQAWAFNLRDALERAMEYSARWFGAAPETAPSVLVDTDFVIETKDDAGAQTLIMLRKQGELTLATLLREYQRRGILSADVDIDKEVRDILAEDGGEDDDSVPNPPPVVEDPETEEPEPEGDQL